MDSILRPDTSLLVGLADFGGGLLTRRAPALTVVVVSQGIAAAVLGVIVVATGGWSEAGPRLWFAFARAWSGRSRSSPSTRRSPWARWGVVSPLATLSVAVPVGVGLFLGERPGVVQVAGIAVAVTGVVLAGGPQLRGAPVQRRAILLTLVAAGGFGTVFALITEASTNVTGLFLALFVQRLTNAPGAARPCGCRAEGSPALPEGGFAWSALPALAFVGLADVAANGTYSVAAQHGPVTVAAVLASLLPGGHRARGPRLPQRTPAGRPGGGGGLRVVGTLLLATG